MHMTVPFDTYLYLYLYDEIAERLFTADYYYDCCKQLAEMTVTESGNKMFRLVCDT